MVSFAAIVHANRPYPSEYPNDDEGRAEFRRDYAKWKEMLSSAYRSDINFGWTALGMFTVAGIGMLAKMKGWL